MKIQVKELNILGKEIIPASEIEITYTPKYFLIHKEIEIENILDLDIIIASC